ncbi:hypothetical protein L1887_38793 [Cichorium endivia]|nr:hypothetical protein L1887_38793 [Cichorium endivia]
MARSNPNDVNGNQIRNKPFGSVGSIVDASYESGGDMVHFDDRLKFTLSELLTASAMCLYENPYRKTYVAYLADCSQVVVKRILTHLRQKDLVTAVSALGKIRHMNVLDLKAYYWGTGETLCVFKFLPNGSVASLLRSLQYQDASITAFDWPLRIKIIIGITRGVYYLHTKEKIVHGDLKLSNIMLDENYNPMIANAGLAQLMPATPHGFQNNYAPEFSGSVTATTETDIYSLGIIMLELLTGQSTYRRINPVNLPRWVKSVPKERWFSEVFEVKLIQEKSSNHNMLVKIMTLALQCVDYNPTARPTVKDVLWALEQMVAKYHHK